MELSRRRLVQAGLAGAAWSSAMSLPGFDEVFEATQADAVAPPKCLVMIYLQSGNDGLGVVNPGSDPSSGYGTYATLRPMLHRGQGATTGGVTGSTNIVNTGNQIAWSNMVVSTPGGGDNGSSLYGFDQLWGAGNGDASSQLAIFPSTDYNPGSLSHFDSQDYWFAGALAGSTTGWLGRWVDRNGTTTNPLQAVSIDTSLSKAIRSAVNPVCAIPATTAGQTGTLGFSMRTGSGYDMPAGAPSTADINAQMTAFSGMASANALLTRDRTTYGQAVAVAGNGTTINALGASTVAYPTTGYLAMRLKLAARILAANVGTRVITIHWGSFDTHAGQLSQQDPQLAELSVALGAFQADLKARGIEQNVVTMAFSEFGRRVGENDGAGTDHGAGGFMMLAGSQVKGGLRADPGNVADLDRNGNLKVTADYRAVYSSILTDWLGGDTSGVMAGAPYSPSLTSSPFR